MTDRPPYESSAVTSVVVRAWVSSPAGQPKVVRYRVTHVQTGQISYFDSLQGVMHYIDELSAILEPSKQSYPPIDFAQWRRAAEQTPSV
jgi:hypothetical protein